ncbi:hypothetical protein [Bdellovibrio bacteriovorus]|uniref:hypothetical protein n=1 Tax=Bdellovibrio bacteriovorus TaxID=959 RepID=UPI0035A66ECE
MKLNLLIFVLLLLAPQVHAKHPKCDGPENWPASMAHATLKNSKIIDNDKFNFSKTKVSRIASEKIGKNLYKQVHFVKFYEKKGQELSVITVSDSSNEECSMGKVQVYVISSEH